jgi:hypothetical protein
VLPLAIDGIEGITAIDTNFAAVTVSVVLPMIVPCVAEMTVLPGATPVACPEDEIVAAAGVADIHVTVLETFFVVLSLKVPVATNCCWAPTAIEGEGGVTAIETSVGVDVEPPQPTAVNEPMNETAKHVRTSSWVMTALVFMFTAPIPPEVSSKNEALPRIILNSENIPEVVLLRGEPDRCTAPCGLVVR